MTRAPYRIHKLIQDMMRDPAAAARFATDPQPIFDQYEISPEEAALLDSGSMEAMTGLGVHPNLQMKYLRLRHSGGDGAKLVGAGPLDAYLDRLLER
ncbi:MAG: hypothetical protein EP321_11800 [Sphingomonadales bacterium]|nr:MAG: hypothetical protein EP345_12400 [Sphingomonadales bacterium]TNF03044.1 MAG: hypothetical protein EP321_11800 [Sphingomonadales bacterium]